MFNKTSALIISLLLALSPAHAENTDYANPILSKSTSIPADDIAKTTLQIIYNLNPALSPYNLKISVKDEVATLEGAVSNQSQKDLAGLIAANYQGINSINNNIVVDPKTKAGENTSAYARQIADATITTLIKTRMALDPEVSARNIQIITANNIVSLSGTVNSLAEKAKAGNIAINTTGVDTVKNNLTVAKK